MGLGLFLVSTLGGYWFLTHLHCTRYDAQRDAGYHVFFRAAIYGGILAGFGHLFVPVLNRQQEPIGSPSNLTDAG